MNRVPLNKEVILDRLAEIEKSLIKLKKFQAISLEEFKKADNFAISEHHLRRSLEAMLEIGSHILARIPGAKPKSYKDIPTLLGENQIIPKEFANKKLKEMAGYRNRLIHFYKEITTEEMYYILQEDLKDIEKFVQYIGSVLKNPKDFGLEVE